MHLKFIFSIAAFILMLVSCISKEELDITGKWTSTSIIDKTENKISDEMVFGKDGNYKMTVYAEDSIIFKMNGTYTFDKTNQTFIIIEDGITSRSKIIDHKLNTIEIQTETGAKMTMNRIKDSL